MLPQENRLKQDKDFRALFSNKTKGTYGTYVGAKWKKNSLNVVRAAVVVGTKVSKKAVIRNHLRRQIREILRLNLAKLKPGHDLVLIVKKEAMVQEHKTLEKDVLFLLKKAQLM
ncbi:MAG: ribonuclease P protein component [Candidatus Uhrbacteria bacterium]